jgi:cephalosporin-C deacetylase-like acetyl esterase
MRSILCILLVVSGAVGAGAQPLAGTKPLETQGDLASQMVDGIDRFLLRKTTESVATRKLGPESRARLARILGVIDTRAKEPAFEYVTGPDRPSQVGHGEGYRIDVVRWEVLPGVHGEGLLFTPTDADPAADVVAIPDADVTPEQLAGLVPGIEGERQFAWMLGLSGCRVVVPTLISRGSEFSVMNSGKKLDCSHREFVYRPAFEVGRTVVGYEVQKVLGAIDAMQTLAPRGKRKVAVVGHGEGGLIALCAGALDTRIDVVGVSGAFGPMEGVWRQPIERNVFGLLREFGGAELASLVAPRALVIDDLPWPVFVAGPQPKLADAAHVAAPGKFETPSKEAIDAEVARAEKLASPGWKIIRQDLGGLLFDALGRDARLLSLRTKPPAYTYPPIPSGATPDVNARQKRQIEELQAFTQSLVRKSDQERAKLWSKVDRTSVAKYEETIKPSREKFYDGVIGRFHDKLMEPNARTRKVFDEPMYTGYEVMLDVWPDVFAYGILLVPKDIKPGEKRPLVVCQHGLEGRPQDVADPKVDSKYYHRFACRLAEEGFITYAPQNPYIFGDRFRSLQRKLNPLGKQLYSVIIPQHQQTVNWLSTLDFVDSTRIAFYGLSYGGKTAMRVPAVETRYCLSICSGDFNEWVWKNTSLDYAGSYVGTGEYEIFEWNLANAFNYAEMAGLIAPRPFMVERGHHDGVAPDEWEAYEYAKVRRLYAELGIPERTRIEFFLGPHEIHGVGTFEFLREKLKWPKH